MRLRLLIVVSLLGPLLNCGGTGSGGGSIMNPPPVHASGGFTNANLSGGYAYGVSGVSGNLATGGSGVITADGNGNLTAGEETDNIGGTSCHETLSGTYTVNADGSGTASVNITPDAPSISKGCLGGPANLSLSLGNGGSTLILASQDAGSVTVVTAIKQ